MTVTLRLAKAAGIVHVPASATKKAGQNEHDRPDVVPERAQAAKEMHAQQHRIISPAPEDMGAVKTLLDSAPKGHFFTDEQQRLMNVQLRMVSNASGGQRQERPLLYLSHDEKVFWAHDGRTFEWRSTTEEPEVTTALRGKGFGSSIMVAMFVSVFGVFYWEITRYGGAKYGYWNGPRMRRHTTEAMEYAAVTFPSVSPAASVGCVWCGAPPHVPPRLCRLSSSCSWTAARATSTTCTTPSAPTRSTRTATRCAAAWCARPAASLTRISTIRESRFLGRRRSTSFTTTPPRTAQRLYTAAGPCVCSSFQTSPPRRTTGG